MNTSKKLGITSIFTAIASIVLYCSILFIDFDMIEYEFLSLPLFFAQVLLILTIVFIISAILISKDVFELFKIKKVIITLTSLILILCVLLNGYNAVTLYDGYTPQKITEDEEFAQGFFPYHQVDDDDVNICVSVSHITGTEYFMFSSYGLTENGDYLRYNMEYFESLSPLMNFDFYLERGVLSFSDMIYVGSFTDCETKVIDGIKVTIFTKAKGGDIGVYIRKGTKAVYAELIKNSLKTVSVEDFTKTVAEQFELIEKTADEGAFLDIPFSDKFERRVLDEIIQDKVTVRNH